MQRSFCFLLAVVLLAVFGIISCKNQGTQATLPDADEETVADTVITDTTPQADTAVAEESADLFDTAGADDATEELDAVFVPEEDILPDIDTASNAPCQTLFGVPNDKTGLTAAQCLPSCNCEGKNFTPPVYSQADMQALDEMVLMNPFAEVTENPYDTPEQHKPVAGAICGLKKDTTNPKGYWLKTFMGKAAAEAEGYVMTHNDACGVCSPLKDLLVYMRQPDLTDPVRQCGLNNVGNKAKNIECLQKLGFDLPCAQIWYFNTQHTQSKCFTTCMADLNKPYHNADGTLNDCLLCDEKNSGDVFKSVAGRNRRNTGLPSSMCRPCAEVVPVVHKY